MSDPGFCHGCSKIRDEVHENLCPSCWRYLYPDASSPFTASVPCDSVGAMLKTFVRSLIPTIEALASQVPEVKLEALALAAKMRNYVGDAEPSVGPVQPDPG